jgi:hypothetical protein
VIASDPVSDEDALPGIEQIFAEPVLDDQTITERSTGGGSRRSLGDDALADTTSVGQRPLLDGIVDNASRTTTQRLDNTRPIVVNDVRAVREALAMQAECRSPEPDQVKRNDRPRRR